MAGRKDTFTEIYNGFYPLVFSAVYTKVENIDDTKDICQDVFIKFYEKFDDIEDHRKWLYGALRLAVFEFYRKKKGNINIDDLFNDISLTFVNGFRNARIILSEAFDNIENFSNENEKTLFDLIAVYNYSYTEAGKELGLTKRQVEYKYRSIVDRILDYLKKQGIENIGDLL